MAESRGAPALPGPFPAQARWGLRRSHAWGSVPCPRGHPSNSWTPQRLAQGTSSAFPLGTGWGPRRLWTTAVRASCQGHGASSPAWGPLHEAQPWSAGSTPASSHGHTWSGVSPDLLPELGRGFGTRFTDEGQGAPPVLGPWPGTSLGEQARSRLSTPRRALTTRLKWLLCARGRAQSLASGEGTAPPNRTLPAAVAPQVWQWPHSSLLPSPPRTEMVLGLGQGHLVSDHLPAGLRASRGSPTIMGQ